jgi:hypothetical protein
VVKLGAVLVWQLLHWTPVTGTCGGVVWPIAVVPLWQLEQLVSLAECTKVVYEPHAVSLGVWHLPQSVPLPWSPLALTPLWQVAQVTPVTAACVILQVVAEPPLSKLVVLAWQEMQSAVPVGICPVNLV